MALQRPRLVLALKNREKYLKTCKVAQNFSFFLNFQKKLEKKNFWPKMAIFGHFYYFRPNFGHFWTNFDISPKVDKLYLKMKLLARAFQKSQSQGQKRST